MIPVHCMRTPPMPSCAPATALTPRTMSRWYLCDVSILISTVPDWSHTPGWLGAASIVRPCPCCEARDDRWVSSRRPMSDGFDYTFRFYVPQHEMEMCGHATIGALWVLGAKGILKGPHVRIDTRSGPVSGYVDLVNLDNPSAEITQPAG